jgi:hypothetical protein
MVCISSLPPIVRDARELLGKGADVSTAHTEILGIREDPLSQDLR